MDPSPLPTFTINGFVADLGSETLHDRKGNALALRPQAFMVLRHLLLNSGRLVTKDELIETVWPATAVTDDSIVQCIHEIRRALNDDAHAVLKTVPRRGYRLVLPTNAAIGLPRRSLVAASIVGVLMIIAGAAASWWLLGSPSTPIGKPVVAVLPFDNYGDSEATGRLADGLAEDIITDLARFPEFQVIARHSTQIYAGRSITSAEIGKALGVSFLVQGSILRRAGRLRITAQLLDAATGKHLWSDRWDRPHEDLFAIQTEISEQVSNRLGGGSGVIEEAGRIAAHRKPPSDLTAYELYLLGTEKLAKINRADVEEAIKLLKRAVELDPGLARAWVELYHAYGVMPSFGADFEANFRLAAEAAERAVMLDPSDAEAHAVLGFSFGDRNDLARAKMEFDTALRMAPNQFEILTFYAFLASSFGEPQRGAEMTDQAIRLNPNYPMWSRRIFAAAYFMAGRYEDALRMQKQMGQENYGRRMWVYRPAALAATGRTVEAKTALAEALKWFPDLTIEGFVSLPDTIEDDRRRLIETMRLAGFPPCAKPEALARFEKPVRLPECVER
ncbi:MAG: adenylate/guanylate cyclase domain-containing protein [Mesorhizobium sp.]|uniref:winged helix-turn-helix domain-containing tetratricopeptide repeat protein n=2 Tax=Mesorhizobium TaxID=68287 RepID=UPI000FE4A354|nr:winged helix-turn-helix domain-containing protein [Mesorhizobium sp.]RWC11712.1 MAG: adenylate/guanylate cyclase domain-containing protein [Mesorhizobium sp.]